MTAKLSIISLALAMSLGTAPVSADPSKEDVEGALLLLGIAALAHHSHHYREGNAPSGAEQTADFERGYRDGVHGYDYDSHRSSAAYGNGFDAGHRDRANRTTHRTRVASDNQNVPTQAMQGCAKIVATNYGVGMHDVHITRTVNRGPDDYLVEAAVGHDYMNCVMGGGGKVVDVVGGRIQ